MSVARPLPTIGRVLELTVWTVLGLVTVAAGSVVFALNDEPGAPVAAAVALSSGSILGILLAFAFYRSQRRRPVELAPILPSTLSVGARLRARFSGDRTKDELLADFGHFVRFCFFVAAAAALYLWWESSDWSAFNTPFAQMTLALLFQALAKAVVGISVAWWWFAWAFAEREHRAYGAWGYFGLAGILIGVGLWLRLR